MQFKPRSRRAVWRVARRALVDALEPRRLLSSQVYNGTDSPDTIGIYTVGNQQHVEINGQDNVLNDSVGPWQITINMKGGDDTVLFTTAIHQYTFILNGDDGNDTLANAPTNSGYNLWQSFFNGVTLNGGNGDDRVELNDSDTLTQDRRSQYVLSWGSFSKDGRLLLDCPGARIDFVASPDSDSIFFTGSPFTQLSIDAGPGDDLLSTYDLNQGGGTLSSELPQTTLVGGSGSDALTIDDTIEDDVTRYELNGAAFTVDLDILGNETRTLTLADDSFESLQLFEGHDSTDTVLTSKSPNLQVLVSTADGNDTVIGGGGDIDSNGWSNATVQGDSGFDKIVFDDSLDAPNPSGQSSEVETYTMEDQSLFKGTFGFNYSQFEEQTLYVGDQLSDVSDINTVNVNVIHAALLTTIIGGDVRASTVNVGSGTLDSIAGPLILSMGTLASLDTVNVFDQNDASNNSYTLLPTQLQRVGNFNITFTGIASLTVNAGAGNDTIDLPSASADIALTVNAGNGNDTVTAGAGNIDDDLDRPITINGGGGTDKIVFDNSLDTSYEAQSLSSSGFSDGFPHSFSAVETITINAGPGGGTINLNSIPGATTVNGGSGSDNVNIGAGNLNNLGASIVVNGGAGSDSVSLLGQSDTADTEYTFLSTTVFRRGDMFTGKTVAANSVESETLQCGSGDDTVTVNANSRTLSIFANGGNDDISVLSAAVPVTVDTGTESINFTAPFGDSLSVSSSGGSSATVILDQDDTILDASVFELGKLRIPSAATLRIAGLARATPTLGLTGVIDLAGGALLWHGGSAPAFGTFLTRGYKNGAWNGTSTSGAINSSLANSSAPGDGVGYGLGSEIGPTSVGPFAIAAGDTLVRYTLDGDATLDTTVDTVDFNILAANFSQNGKAFSRGDFNYDGSVDTIDFNLLASNFSRSLPQSSPSAAPFAKLPSSIPTMHSLFNAEVRIEPNARNVIASPDLMLS